MCTDKCWSRLGGKVGIGDNVVVGYVDGNNDGATGTAVATAFTDGGSEAWGDCGVWLTGALI